MKLHAKSKHEINQVDGKTSLAEIIHEEENIKKYNTFESICNYIVLILIFKMELEKGKLIEKEKGSKSEQDI